MTSLSSALARPNPHHVAPRKLAFSRAPSWKIQFTIFLCFSFTFPYHTPSLQPTNWIEPRPPRPDRLVWLASSKFNEHAKQTLTQKARAGGEKKTKKSFRVLFFVLVTVLMSATAPNCIQMPSLKRLKIHGEFHGGVKIARPKAPHSTLSSPTPAWKEMCSIFFLACTLHSHTHTRSLGRSRYTNRIAHKAIVTQFTRRALNTDALFPCFFFFFSFFSTSTRLAKIARGDEKRKKKCIASRFPAFPRRG